MKKFKILICSVFLGAYAVQAQTMPEYNFYEQNPLLINPAGAGIAGNMVVNLGHKIQWLGFKDAPQNSCLTLDGLLTKSMGLGVILNKQTLGQLETFNISLNYSYRVALAQHHTLGLGANVNFLQNKISENGLSDAELLDPALKSNLFEESLLTNAFGLSYRFKNLAVDVSSPYLYSTEEKTFLQTGFFHAAYDFYSTDKLWRFQPSALFKYYRSAPRQAEAGVSAEWNNNIWTKAKYRTNNDLIFSAGIYMKFLGIGYCYELNLEPLSNTPTAGSHEIMLYFDTGFSVSKKEPLYRSGSRRSAWE